VGGTCGGCAGIAPEAEMPRIEPAPEWLTSASPMVLGGPSEGAVQVREGSYPGRGGRSSGEVRDRSMVKEVLLALMIFNGGGFKLN